MVYSVSKSDSRRLAAVQKSLARRSGAPDLAATSTGCCAVERNDEDVSIIDLGRPLLTGSAPSLLPPVTVLFLRRRSLYGLEGELCNRGT